VFKEQGHHQPLLVQAYTWPVIQRGRHLVALAPPRCGKTLAYLLPLLQALATPDMYKEILQNGSGVTVLQWINTILYQVECLMSN